MGDLPRMTDRQYRRAKRLIRRLCANYDGGSCLPLDDGDFSPCPQSLSPTLICKYFRTAVLPADRELCAEITGETYFRKCHICGVSIAALSNAAKYCPTCALRERRRRDAERKRNRSRTSANRSQEMPAPQGFTGMKPGVDKDLSPNDKIEL